MHSSGLYFICIQGQSGGDRKTEARRQRRDISAGLGASGTMGPWFRPEWAQAPLAPFRDNLSSARLCLQQFVAEGCHLWKRMMILKPEQSQNTHTPSIRTTESSPLAALYFIFCVCEMTGEKSGRVKFPLIQQTPLYIPLKSAAVTPVRGGGTQPPGHQLHAAPHDKLIIMPRSIQMNFEDTGGTCRMGGSDETPTRAKQAALLLLQPELLEGFLLSTQALPHTHICTDDIIPLRDGGKILQEYLAAVCGAGCNDRDLCDRSVCTSWEKKTRDSTGTEVCKGDTTRPERTRIRFPVTYMDASTLPRTEL